MHVYLTFIHVPCGQLHLSILMMILPKVYYDSLGLQVKTWERSVNRGIWVQVMVHQSLKAAAAATSSYLDFHV